jgi:hypothetical protein
MNYFKYMIILLLWIQLLGMSLFASPILEDMAVEAEYIGVVNITKDENATVASLKMGWNNRSENNISRYSLEIIDTIKGDVPNDGKLIMDIWQKDYLEKVIKPLPTGGQALVFLVKFKPWLASWTLEKKLGHLMPIIDYDSHPHNYYYGIRLINGGKNIRIQDKSYSLPQIKQITHACNSKEFRELQKHADLLRDKKQYEEALKLYRSAYRMCPTSQIKLDIDFLNERVGQKTLSWQIKQAGLPILLFEVLFFLIFFAMGYYAKWRWTGMVFVIYILPLIYLLSFISKDIPLVVLFSFIVPFVSYGLGTVWYRTKNGVWLQDKVKEEMAQSFIEGEDEDGPYIVWEYEAAIFNRTTIIMMTALFVSGIFLLIYAKDKNIEMLVPSTLIPLILLALILLSALIMFNRLRYRYGCYGKGYGYAINDSRKKLISTLSATIGVADNNPTLAGLGLISSGIGGVHREWSSVKWCRYDDDKKIIVINHGCCKSDKLYATKRSYNGLKAIVMKAVGGKCTGTNDERSGGSKDVR